VGLLTELELSGESLFLAASLATLAAYVVSCLSFLAWANWLGRAQLEDTKVQVSTYLTTQMQNTKDLPTDWIETLLWQTPSVVLILLIFTAVIVLSTDRMAFRLTQGKRTARYVLDQFAVPDAFVWLALASILFSFLEGVPRWVTLTAMNALNVMIVLYFLQGMAVVQHVFRAMRLSPMWRWLTSILLVLHLFVLVSGLGFLDYWLNFRHRLRKTDRLSRAFKQGE
jgi:hypothetical protein